MSDSFYQSYLKSTALCVAKNAVVLLAVITVLYFTMHKNPYPTIIALAKPHEYRLYQPLLRDREPHNLERAQAVYPFAPS